MNIRKLRDAATLKFVGWALLFHRPQTGWTPRYDSDGNVYMWLRMAERIDRDAGTP